MHMSWDCRQLPLKTLLNTLGICHKNIWKSWHGGYPYHPSISSPGSCAPDHTMPKGHNESSNKCSEETDIHHPLAELLEQLWQLQEKFNYLKSATHPPTPTTELIQLTDKLQHLTMMLQPHPTPKPNQEPMHKTMQTYTATLHATQREANLTMTKLQDIPTFDGQHSSRLEDWFLDIETITDILTESHTYLAEAQFTKPNPHSYLWGSSSREVLRWNQEHP